MDWITRNLRWSNRLKCWMFLTWDVWYLPRMWGLGSRNRRYCHSEYESYTPDALRIARKEKQPAGFSCGSFFKNPPWRSAGKLIDEAGLKATRIGGVRISEQHGNLFLNDEKAKWQDIIELRNLVKNTILSKYGIPLQEEVRIITNES